MRDAVGRRPQFSQHLEPLVEDALIVLERDMERQIFALVVAAASGEIDASVAEQIERRPLLRDADRVMQRQHRHRGREPDVLRARRDIGEHQVRTGEHAERVEMMLADPGRVHAELVGQERFLGDVGDELVRGPGVVLVVIVAQGEIAEVHGATPVFAEGDFFLLLGGGGIIDAFTIVVNAIDGRCVFARPRLSPATVNRQRPCLGSCPDLLQRDAGDLDRVAPERDLFGDEGGELRRIGVGRIDADSCAAARRSLRPS